MFQASGWKGGQRERTRARAEKERNLSDEFEDELNDKEQRAGDLPDCKGGTISHTKATEPFTIEAHEGADVGPETAREGRVRMLDEHQERAEDDGTDHAYLQLEQVIVIVIAIVTATARVIVRSCLPEDDGTDHADFHRLGVGDDLTPIASAER